MDHPRQFAPQITQLAPRIHISSLYIPNMRIHRLSGIQHTVTKTAILTPCPRHLPSLGKSLSFCPSQSPLPPLTPPTINPTAAHILSLPSLRSLQCRSSSSSSSSSSPDTSANDTSSSSELVMFSFGSSSPSPQEPIETEPVPPVEEQQQQERPPDHAPSPPPASTSSVLSSIPDTLPIAPWTISTTLTVMGCWLIAFYVAAYDIVPFFLRTLGYGKAATASLPTVQALRHLLLDATQLTSTLLLLHRALRSHAPRSLGLFAAQWRPLRDWVPAVLVGLTTFPLVDFIHKQMVVVLSSAPSLTTTTTSAAPGANAAFVDGATWQVRATWFLVLAVCAPLWEEIMFRGFLMPSLARYIGAWGAVAASSLVFATVHFTQEGFVPLLLLGSVFGAAYLKTRNLVPAVLLHSLWNVALLTQILSSA